MVEHTKAIQDKFAEIAAKLSNLDSFFDDIPGAKIGGGESITVEHQKDETLTPELAAFLTGIDDTTKSEPTTPTDAIIQPFSHSDYEIYTGASGAGGAEHYDEDLTVPIRMFILYPRKMHTHFLTSRNHAKHVLHITNLNIISYSLHVYRKTNYSSSPQRHPTSSPQRYPTSHHATVNSSTHHYPTGEGRG
jgi:hypothetical protein